MAKELDQEARLNETIPQKGNVPDRQAKVHLEKKIVLHVSFKKGACSHDRDCDYWNLPAL